LIHLLYEIISDDHQICDASVFQLNFDVLAKKRIDIFVQMTRDMLSSCIAVGQREKYLALAEQFQSNRRNPGRLSSVFYTVSNTSDDVYIYTPHGRGGDANRVHRFPRKDIRCGNAPPSIQLLLSSVSLSLSLSLSLFLSLIHFHVLSLFLPRTMYISSVPSNIALLS